MFTTNIKILAVTLREYFLFFINIPAASGIYQMIYLPGRNTNSKAYMSDFRQCQKNSRNGL